MPSASTHSADTSQCPACGVQLPSAGAEEIPQQCPQCASCVLDKYCDLERIGGGAMGDVYRARDTQRPGNWVAIKVPKPHSDRAKQRMRFEREITATSLLNHENIVRAVDRGEVRGQPYLVMEYVEGVALHEVLHKQYPLAESRAAEIVRGIAAGLAHAETYGIVNRDIKPENILLATHDIPKILDFGLALVRHLDPIADRVTQDGTLLGTPSFISPEQILNPHDATILSDIYSLGCTAFYLLAGETPFAGTSLDVYRSHSEAPRPDIREQRGDLSREFAELIRNMMATSPQQRPTPAEVIAEIDRIAPHLRSEAPSPEQLQPTDQPDWEVVSSSPLEETDELAPVMGEMILDSNQDDYTTGHPLDSEPVVGVAVEEEEPVVGEALEDDDFPPPIQGSDEFANETAGTNNGHTDNTTVATLPLSAIVDDASASSDTAPEIQPGEHDDLPPPVQPEASSEPIIPPPKGRKKHSLVKLAAAFATAAVVCLATALVVLMLNQPPDPEEAWSTIQDDYRDRKWSRVENGLAEFREEFPESPRVAEVPFFLEMARAGENVFSINGNAEQGLATLETIFQEYRDTPQYEAYTADLYLALARLIERFLEQCVQTNNADKLVQARTAHGLLSTVAEGMTDDWVGQQTKELSAKITIAGDELKVRVAREQATRLLKLAAHEQTSGSKRDRIFAAVEKLQQQFEPLATDKELAKLLEEALASESERVVYVEKPAGSTGRGGEGFRNDTLYVTWASDAPAPPTTGEREIFASLAQGILYVFDSEGNHLWSRRLGIDSHRLPISLKPSPTSPDALIAVSTHDNALVALASGTGRELWRYSVSSREAPAAPLTVSRWQPAPNRPEIVRGFLPTASGEVHVLELIGGNRLGLYRTGFPMTQAGTYDPHSELVYFPAESERVFALDPSVIENPQQQSQAASSVLMTGHASGSLRWPPVIVGQYFVIAEAYNLEQTRVRVFPLRGTVGFDDPRVAPLAEATLRGWSWFRPPATPDRITLVTDEGQLGLFGLNLDNRQEALYKLIETPAGGYPQLSINSPFRALALRNDDHRLWVAAGGKLQMLALDLYRQQVRPVWPAEGEKSPVNGFPLHEAQWSASGETLFLTTQSVLGTQAAFHAVNADTGSLLWERKLGVNLAVDPYRLPDGNLLLIDWAARVLQVSPADEEEKLPQLTHDHVEPPTTDAALQVIHDPSGGLYLFLSQDSGSQFAIRNLRNGLFESQWEEIRLPAVEIQGTPAVIGEHVIVPCSDGRLHRFRVDGAPSSELSEVPYTWAQESSLAPDQPASVQPLSDTEILLLHDNQARLLSFGSPGGVAQWSQQGIEFLADSRLRPHALVTQQHVYVIDRNKLYRLNREKFSVDPPAWELAGEVSSAPVLAGEHVIVVEEGRRVICFDEKPSAADSFQPRWQSDPLPGRISGNPRVLGKYLLVTEESGGVHLMALSDGSRRTVEQLEPGLIPSASAARIGNRLFIPLIDGTLLCREPGQSKPREEEN